MAHTGDVRRDSLTFCNPRKAVRAPVLASHAVVDEEQAARVEAVLDRAQARIIAAPERAPPGLVEVVALRNIGAWIAHELAQLCCGEVDQPRVPVRGGYVHRRAR